MEAKDNCDLPGIQSSASLYAKLNSSSVAKALFPEVVVVVARENVEVKHLWHEAQEKVVEKFAKYNLSVECNHASRAWTDITNWARGVNRVKFEVNRKVLFYCSRCKEHSNFLSPICHAMCSNGIINPTTQQVTQVELLVQKVFFHDKECCVGDKGEGDIDIHPLLQQQGYAMTEFDFDEVIGDTYKEAVEEIESFDPLAGDNPELPKGQSINFGSDEIQGQTSDRMYEPLPSDKYPSIIAEWHQHSMIRFYYHMVATFNMSKEASPFVFDEAGQTIHGILDDLMEKRPKLFHLSIDMPSLLFGGHTIWDDNLPIVHQMCHQDCSGLEQHLKQNPSCWESYKFLPGSFIIPLKDSREIYIRHPGQVRAKVKKGEYLFFNGTLEHGGMTFKKKEHRGWHPAIHGHLDHIILGEYERDKEEVGLIMGEEKGCYSHPYHMSDTSVPGSIVKLKIESMSKNLETHLAEASKRFKTLTPEVKKMAVNSLTETEVNNMMKRFDQLQNTIKNRKGKRSAEDEEEDKEEDDEFQDLREKFSILTLEIEKKMKSHANVLEKLKQPSRRNVLTKKARTFLEHTDETEPSKRRTKRQKKKK